jgi:hypothetical protein
MVIKKIFLEDINVKICQPKKYPVYDQRGF